MTQYEARQYAMAHNDVIFLDIRSFQEHRERAIPGSLHLSYFEMSYQRAWQVLGQPDMRPVMVYCRSGAHSGPAVRRLRQYGYNAVDMGGLDEWEGPLVGYWA